MFLASLVHVWQILVEGLSVVFGNMNDTGKLVNWGFRGETNGSGIGGITLGGGSGFLTGQYGRKPVAFIVFFWFPISNPPSNIRDLPSQNVLTLLVVIDNLVAARIVVADGSVYEVSETQNSDLFWGIRGGGSNFGVITEFTYKVHKQDDVFL